MQLHHHNFLPLSNLHFNLNTTLGQHHFRAFQLGEFRPIFQRLSDSHHICMVQRDAEQVPDRGGGCGVIVTKLFGVCLLEVLKNRVFGVDSA